MGMYLVIHSCVNRHVHGSKGLFFYFFTQAYVVSQLVQEDPEKRPSTNQLLQDLNEDKDVTIARLKDDLAQKDDAIRKLHERILALEEQTAKNNTSLRDI